jgi:hypothetical protein
LNKDGLSEASIRRMWEHITPVTPLHTSDDRPLSVLSPGRPNSDGGPDYLDALIRLDGRLYRGDVEVHLHERDWTLHHHNADVHYNRVILHVVGFRGAPAYVAHTAAKRRVPALVMLPDGKSAPITPVGSSGRFSCAAAGLPISPGKLRRMLLRLGRVRIERRVATLEARLNELLLCEGNELAADALWDQLLYEGIVEAMGYAKNKTPFRALSQSVPLPVLQRWASEDRELMMALLFGVSGLLPSTRGLKERESRHYVLRLRKRWNGLRRELRCPLIHEADWLFFRLRPVNFPTARLAVLGHLLHRTLRDNMAGRVLRCFRTPGLSTHERHKRLRKFFAFTPDAFWSAHLHFRGSAPGTSIALGTDRIDAIIFNTVVPMVLLHVRLFSGRIVDTRVRALVRMLPAPPPNSVTRFVKQHVVHGKVTLDSAVVHHGAIELYRAFCERGRCRECPMIHP